MVTNKQYRKRRPYFDNKTCDICKKPAIMFRLIENKTFMLCNNKHCDKISRIKVGWLKLRQIGKYNG